MVAAESLHGHNPAGSKIMHGLWDGLFIAAHNFIARLKVIMRSADGACDGLGMKAPIRRIAVLCGAMLIQEPRGHRGTGAIVRQASNHAVARAAVRAIDIGIMIAMIPRIEEFLKAILAHWQVGRDSNRRPAFAGAFPNR